MQAPIFNLPTLDGGAQTEINIQLDGQVFDLLVSMLPYSARYVSVCRMPAIPRSADLQPVKMLRNGRMAGLGKLRRSIRSAGERQVWAVLNTYRP